MFARRQAARVGVVTPVNPASVSISVSNAYLGIDVGGTSVKLGVCTAAGEVRGRASIPTNPADGATRTLERVARAGAELIANAGGAQACGVGVPGPLDAGRRTLLRANHLPGWIDVPVPSLLARALGGLPVVLENDANCAAWGEYRAGLGRGATSLVLFTLGTGVGGGVVLGGEPWRGAGGAAGALGHIAVDPNGPRCRCGQRGCVEQYASATAVAERYGRGTAEDAFDAARRGDPHAVAVVDWACDGLAAGVANVVHVLQPDVVALGGGMAAAGEVLIERVRAGVQARVRPGWLANVRVELSSLGSDAGWIGAALWAAHTADGARPVRAMDPPVAAAGR